MTAATRFDVATPALILDLDALAANLSAMAAFCRRTGIALRPHAKSHKSARIARLQVEQGAVGVSVATIDEAEVMADAGIPGILLTSPIVSEDKFVRAVAVAARRPDFMLVVDNLEVAAALDHVAARHQVELKTLVDLDVGHRRSGVRTIADLVSLARAVAGAGHLSFAGLQAYAGHVQHVPDAPERRRQAEAVAATVHAARQALGAAGLDPAVVTGGGTGTAGFEPALGAFTEIQAGSYVFMDAEYGSIAFEPQPLAPFRPALFVQVSVISANVPGHVQTDGGTKAFALNGPPPQILRGAPPGSAYGFAGDEHGRVRLPQGAPVLPVGTRIECLTPHCDPTVHLYDAYHCVRGDRLVDRWPVDARGRR